MFGMLIFSKKSPRVADENMFTGNFEPEMERQRRGGARNAFSAIYGAVKVLSCFSPPHVNGAGADGIWVSRDYVQTTEMNHLMVSDSLRYAILM